MIVGCPISILYSICFFLSTVLFRRLLSLPSIAVERDVLTASRSPDLS